jgi:hypothetical protein
MRELTCMCENKFKADFPSVVDLAEKPDTIDIILRGEFLTARCPACGKVLKLEFPFTLINKEAGWEISFIPEAERAESLKKLKDRKAAAAAQRIVIGYPELVEKLKIFKLDLDDRVIEYIKYHLLSHILSNTPEEADVGLYFAEKKNNTLYFHIQGLKADEIGVSKIPMESYEKTLRSIEGKIKEEPYCDFLKPPYISVNKVYSLV